MPGRGRFALVKTTLLDYPGKVAASVFLPGCHLRCPYCHNPEFVEPEFVDRNLKATDLVFNQDFESFHRFLSRRARLLGGLAISGGEALLHPLLPKIISLAEEYKLPVKLDTAGLLPDILAPYLESGRLDYVAMDLKTIPERYHELGWKGSGAKSAEVLLSRTMALLAESGTSYEIRTTVVPPLVNETVLRNLVSLTTAAPRWVWQPYKPGNTLNPMWSNLAAPDEDELRRISDGFETETEIIIR